MRSRYIRLASFQAREGIGRCGARLLVFLIQWYGFKAVSAVRGVLRISLQRSITLHLADEPKIVELTGSIFSLKRNKCFAFVNFRESPCFKNELRRKLDERRILEN